MRHRHKSIQQLTASMQHDLHCRTISAGCKQTAYCKLQQTAAVPASNRLLDALTDIAVFKAGALQRSNCHAGCQGAALL
jgi:hypothetical protein